MHHSHRPHTAALHRLTPPCREVKKHLSQTAMKLQTDWQQFNQKAAYSNFFHAAPVDPFVAPEQIRTKFAGEVTTLCIASLLYTYDAAALATMFFSAHVRTRTRQILHFKRRLTCARAHREASRCCR